MREIMKKNIKYILDIITSFIFPPSEQDLKLLSISKQNIFNILPKSPEPPYPFINSVFSYKDPSVENLIWNIKYKKNRHAIECGGFALYKSLMDTYGKYVGTGKIILIPIPVSSKRRRERGYNQTELIVDEIIKNDTDKFFIKDFSLLVRVKHLDRQTLKSRRDRIIDSRDIFEVDKTKAMPSGDVSNINDKIIIIDDVTTTGSTLKSAYDTLVNAGFGDVSAWSIAR